MARPLALTLAVFLASECGGIVVFVGSGYAAPTLVFVAALLFVLSAWLWWRNDRDWSCLAGVVALLFGGGAVCCAARALTPGGETNVLTFVTGVYLPEHLGLLSVAVIAFCATFTTTILVVDAAAGIHPPVDTHDTVKTFIALGGGGVVALMGIDTATDYFRVGSQDYEVALVGSGTVRNYLASRGIHFGEPMTVQLPYRTATVMVWELEGSSGSGVNIMASSRRHGRDLPYQRRLPVMAMASYEVRADDENLATDTEGSTFLRIQLGSSGIRPWVFTSGEGPLTLPDRSEDKPPLRYLLGVLPPGFVGAGPASIELAALGSQSGTLRSLLRADSGGTGCSVDIPADCAVPITMSATKQQCEAGWASWEACKARTVEWAEGATITIKRAASRFSLDLCGSVDLEAHEPLGLPGCPQGPHATMDAPVVVVASQVSIGDYYGLDARLEAEGDGCPAPSRDPAQVGRCPVHDHLAENGVLVGPKLATHEYFLLLRQAHPAEPPTPTHPRHEVRNGAECAFLLLLQQHGLFPDADVLSPFDGERCLLSSSSVEVLDPSAKPQDKQDK